MKTCYPSPLRASRPPLLPQRSQLPIETSNCIFCELLRGSSVTRVKDRTRISQEPVRGAEALEIPAGSTIRNIAAAPRMKNSRKASLIYEFVSISRAFRRIGEGIGHDRVGFYPLETSSFTKICQAGESRREVVRGDVPHAVRNETKYWSHRAVLCGTMTVPESSFISAGTRRFVQLICARRVLEWWDDEGKLLLRIRHKSGGATAVIDSHSHS